MAKKPEDKARRSHQTHINTRQHKPRHISLVIGAILVALTAIVCGVSLFWTPYDPSSMQPLERFAGPSFEHLFGTDQFGRDVLSRIMDATQVAMLSGVVAVTVGAVAGCVLGFAAGMAGRGLRSVIMRVVDGLMAFPGVLLALMLVLVIGRGLFATLIAVAVFMIPTFARLTSSLVLEERAKPYIKAARSYGCSGAAIAVVHILPNIMARLLTQLTSCVGIGILLESSLSFLGLGVQPPQPSWGVMISEALQYVFTYPGLIVAPGITLACAVLGFNLLGDGLNDALVVGREHKEATR